MVEMPKKLQKIETYFFYVLLNRNFYKMNLIEEHNKDILNLCKAHKVKSLYAFGSVLTDKFNNESDVDLIVDFENLDVLDYGDNYYNLKFSLENILKRSIDLLEEKAIKNPYFRKTLNQNKVLIYG
jgi:predicted nucleotidyltransferase